MSGDFGTDTCKWCGKTFQKTRPRQRFCGKLENPESPGRCRYAWRDKKNTKKVTAEKSRKEVEAFDPLEFAEQADLVKKTKADIKERAHKKAFKAFLLNEARAEMLVEELAAAEERIDDWKPRRLITPRGKREFEAEEAGLVCSDWHGGELTRVEETGGLGEFNARLLEKRVQKMLDSVCEITGIHTKSFDIPTINLWFLGDMMTGEHIFRGQNAYIDMFQADQFLFVKRLMTETILNLRDLFSQVNIVGVVGNHGRLGDKGDGPTWNNWDWLLYNTVKDKLENVDGLNWSIPRAWFAVSEVLGWRFCAQHGDGIKSYLRLPYYGLDRDQKDMSDMLWDLEQTPPYYYLYAHFHTASQSELTHGERLVNGSLVGGSQFSAQKLKRVSKPSQSLFGISRSRGLTYRYNLHVDK